MGHGGDDGDNPAGERREVRALPKAHLHLHFTGSMRHGTLLELAERDGIVLPDSLVEDWPPLLSAADEKGWFRFQRLYDVARSVLRTPDDVRRLVLEAAEDDVRDGGRWLEIQVDPSGYAARFGGITEFTDLVLDCVRDASEHTGLGMAVVIAANRTRHPLDARTLARLAAQYAGRGVVGFGLSNDERRGRTEDFAGAFHLLALLLLLLAIFVRRNRTDIILTVVLFVIVTVQFSLPEARFTFTICHRWLSNSLRALNEIWNFITGLLSR